MVKNQDFPGQKRGGKQNQEPAGARRTGGRGNAGLEEEKANTGRSIGKYESDREDERWNRGRSKKDDGGPARRDIDPHER